MISRKKGILFIIIVLSSLVMTDLVIVGQRGKKGSSKGKTATVNKPREKIQYKNYIWIEGEDAVATNFSREKTYNFYCSSKYALQLSKEADPSSDKGYYATYVFYVSRTKSYDLWMGCTPPGSRFAEKAGYASPFDWKIDEGAFRKASSENIFVKNFYAPGSFYWTRISTGTLAAGKHTLTIRVNQKRSSGWDYYLYIDAIVFIPTYGSDLVPLMHFPEAAPGDFTAKGKGITFKNLKTYEKLVVQKRYSFDVVFPLLQAYIWLYNYDKAIELCKTYLKKNPKDVRVRLLLASNYAWSDQLDSAIKEYKNIIAIDQKNITARKLLAVLAGWNNRYDEAIKNYREIIAIDRNNVDAYISLATQLSWKGEVEKSLAVFEQAESIAPNNIEVLYALGDNYNWSGKTAKSIQKFKDIMALNEKEILAYKKLATIYLDMGDQINADRVLSQARQLQQVYPELSGFSLDVKGEQAKRTRVSIDEYKAALKNNPENLEARKNLIDTYRWNKMDQEAFIEYNNLLNVKVALRINATGERIGKLQLETIGLEIVSPDLAAIQNITQRLADQYKSQADRVKANNKPSEEFTRKRIVQDYIKIKALEKKTDFFEQKLAGFNDVIAVYQKDVRNYHAQKGALDWELDRDRVLEQARKSEQSDPKDYRPKKVIGLIELLYGSSATAVTNLAYVYKQDPEPVVPLYIYSLTQAGNMKKSADVITQSITGKKGNSTDLAILREIQSFIGSIKTKKEQQIVTTKKTSDLITEISSLSKKTGKKLKELVAEKDKKLVLARSMIKDTYEKGFLDMEYDNVPVYKEIGQYYLNQEDMSNAIINYTHILQVQPQNVTINYTLGNMNESMGYKATALEHYELCINNQPTNARARKSHYELQQDFSPAVKNGFNYVQEAYDGETTLTRMTNSLIGAYPLNDFLTLLAGYGFMMIEDSGGTTTGGQEYFASDGNATRHTGYAGGIVNFVRFGTRLYLLGSFHMYSGEVDSAGDTFDSDISYTSVNYSGTVEFFPLRDMQVRIRYAYEDIADLTQSMQLDYRDAITSNTLSATVDLAFKGLEFPLSDRLFLNDSITYRMLSDDNTRTTWYNQLTFRALRFPENGIILNVNAIYSNESSKFTEYDASEAIVNVPYWAPEDIGTFSGGLRFEHLINDAVSGNFTYSVEGQYNYEMVAYAGNNFTQSGFALALGIQQEWANITAGIGYRYSTSTASTAGAKPYTSNEIKFNITGKIFSMYRPKGLGEANLAMVSAEPSIITADGDGKDDYTIFSLTAFDERGIESWSIDVFDEKGTKVQSIGRTGTPPPTIRWDGKDKAGSLLKQGSYYYQLNIVNSAKKSHVSRKERLYLSRKKTAIALTASYQEFSPNGDDVKDSTSFTINATEKKSVRDWTLSISKRVGRKNIGIRAIQGKEFMPYDIEWDGKNNRGATVADDTYYATLNVRFRDNDSVTSPQVPVVVRTKLPLSIRATAGRFLPGKGSVGVRPRLFVKQIDSWTLSVVSLQGGLIQEVRGSGDVPEVINWNGTDKKNNVVGYNMPVTVSLEVVDLAGNRAVSNKLTVWLDNLVKGNTVYLFDQGLLHKRKQAAFSKNADQIVAALAGRIRKIKTRGKLTITAHTSSDGSGDENLKLSEKRAQQLSVMLSKILKGFTITAKGAGESSPYGKGAEGKWDIRYEITIN